MNVFKPSRLPQGIDARGPRELAAAERLKQERARVHLQYAAWLLLNRKWRA